MSTFPSISGPQDPGALNQRLNLLERQLNPPVPQARVYNSANLSIANNTVTTLTFNSERFDNRSVHSTSANTDRLTVSVAGLYMIGTQVRWASSASGYRVVQIRVNGATYIADDVRPPVNGDVTSQSAVTAYRFAADDFVTVEVFQTSGGALNVVTNGNTSPEFWMVRLSGFTAQVFD